MDLKNFNKPLTHTAWPKRQDALYNPNKSMNLQGKVVENSNIQIGQNYINRRREGFINIPRPNVNVGNIANIAGHFKNSVLKKGDVIRLKSMHGTYLQAHKDHVRQTTNKGPWEEWIVDTKFGFMYFWNPAHKRFLRMHSSGKTDLSAPKDLGKQPSGWTWEKFWISKSPKKDWYALWNPKNKRFVRANGDKSKADSAKSSTGKLPDKWEWERFYFEKVGKAEKPTESTPRPAVQPTPVPEPTPAPEPEVKPAVETPEVQPESQSNEDAINSLAEDAPPAESGGWCTIL